MIKAIYPGSFDPVTNGHLDIIKRASKFVDVLVVGILDNPNKHCLFTSEERKELIKIVTKDIPNVEVESFYGLLTDFAKEINASLIIRGIRDTNDFAVEFQRSITNKQLNSDIETVCLIADEKNLILSSTAVKEVAIFGGDIDWMVPKEITGYVKEKYNK
ncbi:MAG: pantetheine-phosphate adenylyltransferase [Firmicutes bacterium]|nr:pantetheine-phosphate adenylyltransferase [Bacillota bacterium]MBQ7241630.1 pantetheine-phosphate adenylyltransferase [Bacillota bacterium]MBR0105118.1 pantetheine-phosphate adenylyltransferase [Bacillota bacterium]MBR2594512.1 pantetheine-phosphate adenylyltransferase [Bacillota bacterium]